jgi:hypothetical protein
MAKKTDKPKVEEKPKTTPPALEANKLPQDDSQTAAYASAPASEAPDPFLGQIVRFLPGTVDRDVRGTAPAMVTFVYNSTCVDLTVFPSGQMPVIKMKVCQGVRARETGVWM